MSTKQVTCQLARKVAGASHRFALPLPPSQSLSAVRNYATISPVDSGARNHKVVVVGGGAAGLSISHQLLHSGKFSKDDIAVVDPAEWHHYQPGWTLVSGGLKNKESLKQKMDSLIDPQLKFYAQKVNALSPDQNSITLDSGSKLNYDHLVLVPGIQVQLDSITGLPEALADPSSPVSTIYDYQFCDKAFRTISGFRKGQAIFTQPAGVVKCAGAPQKAMWLAWDYWRRHGLYSTSDPSSSPIHIAFATSLPTMFGVPKYSAKLEELRQQRGVEGLFQHDLVSIDGSTATFAKADGEKVSRKFDLLHAVPKMGPHAFVKNSPLADQTGYVAVDHATLRHTKYPNVWSAGDAASLPTSKTAAAVTAQSPVIVKNLLETMEGKSPDQQYDGYTSCPLTVGENKVLLAEFMYDGKPKETFGKMFGIDQATPRRAFFHLKKDFFPWVYQKYMVKGKWGGPKGWVR